MANSSGTAVVSEQAADVLGLRLATRLLRCEQWVKNAFVLGGLLFGGQLNNPAKVAAAGAAFLAFSAVASAGYVHNDIADAAVDRRHPIKRRRPIASGKVPVGLARVVELCLLVTGVVVGVGVHPRVGLIVAGYGALTITYSTVLKHGVIVDVMAIAIGFVLRVLAGCAAVTVEPSVWILLCTFLIATFLGFAKRREELSVADGAVGHRRVLTEYGPQFLDQMIALAANTTIVCYIMFTVWPDTVARHGSTSLVYTVPVVIYGLFRYYFLVYQQKRGGNPTDLVLRDHHLIGTIVTWAGLCAAILYGRW